MRDDSSPFETLFIGRQPIFRRDETVWGYELLFRSGEGNKAVIDDEAQATSSVIADGLILAAEGMSPEARMLVNFPQQLLVEDAGFALPKERSVVEILEHVRAVPEALAAARRLKEAGYTLALDDYSGQSELEPFLGLVDIVKLDILALDSDLGRIKAALELVPEGILLLAEKVEDNEMFCALKQLQFDLFQGYFFSKPEIVPGKKLSASETTKLQILSELAKPDLDAARLSEVLRSDPSLSYRLLRYINSAGIGLTQKVSSVKRAIDMMGMIHIKQWLRSVVVTDLSTTPRAGELAYLAVQRAKFLETICSSANLKVCMPDTLFMTGLFSLLDAMLGIEMDQILKLLPLDESVSQALRGDGPIHELVRLATSYERGHWGETSRRLKTLELDTFKAELLYVQARNWAQRMLGYARAKD